jgi:hypothetical protein
VKYRPSIPATTERPSALASPTIWIIELHHGVDNRLTHRLITQAFLPALDVVEKEWRTRRRAEIQKKQEDAGAGALVISGAHNQDKFFSNGTFQIVRGCTRLKRFHFQGWII